MKILGLFPGQGVSLARQLDGGSDHLLQRKLAIFFLGVNHARHRPGHADRLEADFAGTFNDVALGVEVHVARRRGGSLLAIVDKVRRAVGHADEHEASAADISGRRMHHGQREPGRDRGVNGVAASPHDLHSRVRRQVVHADHDGVLGVNRMGGGPRRAARRSAATTPSTTKSMIYAEIACQIEEPKLRRLLRLAEAGKRSQIRTQNRGGLSYRRDSSVLRRRVSGR